MASHRITVTSEPTVYHAITPVKRGEFLFGKLEKDHMLKMVEQMTDFCEAEVLTYAVMNYHVHILVLVPVDLERDLAVENVDVLRRFGVLYRAEAMALLIYAEAAEWLRFRGNYRLMMHDLSWFLRLEKQRGQRITMNFCGQWS